MGIRNPGAGRCVTDLLREGDARLSSLPSPDMVEFDVPQRIGYVSTSMDNLGTANGAGDQFLDVVRAYQEVRERPISYLRYAATNEDGSSSNQLYPGYSKRLEKQPHVASCGADLGSGTPRQL
jgi:hypothetical protein